MAPHVVVVGAGIVGTCVALRLAQRAVDVTLIEDRAPGAGTSGESFAWLDASHPSLEPYVELNLAGLDAWHRLGSSLGHPDWLRLTGTLTWETDPKAAARLVRGARLLREMGHPSAELTPQRVSELEPDLVVDREVESVVFFPSEGHLSARQAIADLLAQGRRVGLRVCCGDPVAGFAGANGTRVTGVVLASGARVHADMVVCCVGRWSEELLRTAAVEIPLVGLAPEPSPAVGLLVLSTPLAARLQRVVFTHGLMMRPGGGGRLLLHGDEQDACVRVDTPMQPPPVQADELLQLARARLRAFGNARVESSAIAIRALPSDRLPVVGHVRDGLYVIVTHSGMTLAPALGEIVAGEILDDRQSDALEQFRPARFERTVT